MTKQVSFCPEADTYIDSNHPDMNFSKYIVNWIGRKNCDTYYQTLLRFDIGAIPVDAVITSAKLKMYVDYAQNPRVTGCFTPYLIIAPWREREVTWATCPAFDPCFAGSTANICDAGWYEWDITALSKAWHNRTYCNYGILLKGNEDSRSDSKRLISRHNTKSTDISLRPVLTVCYELQSDNCKKMVLTGRRFAEKAIIVKTSAQFVPTLAFDTSQQSQVTFFIKNIDAQPATLMYEVGPDKTDYVADRVAFEVLPGETIAIVPRIFGKYTRLLYKSAQEGQDTVLKITFQGQV